MMQQRAGYIKHRVSGCEFWVNWGDLMRISGMYVLHFLPLTYNGEVMKLTWPEVTDIKNPTYTTRRYLCLYCTLRVSKSLDLWCVFDRLSNFEKCNLRSGGPDLWGHLVIVFFWKCAKLLAEQLWQVWRRYAPLFFLLSAKNLSGVDIRPPAVRGLRQPQLKYRETCFQTRQQRVKKLLISSIRYTYFLVNNYTKLCSYCNNIAILCACSRRHCECCAVAVE